MGKEVRNLCGIGTELAIEHRDSRPRQRKLRGVAGLTGAGLGCVLGLAGCATTVPTEQGLTINWNTTTVTNNTTPTLQVVVSPPLRPGEALAAPSFQAVNELAPDYMRFAAWVPYPQLAVAELDAPTAQGTSWDFSLIDPLTKEFLDATEGHPPVITFSTIPQWMFVTDAPVVYPTDPDQEMWNYEQGTELRDPTGQELAGYYTRLASWYVDGGFTDENGVVHASGYHYQFPVWEVLNEPDGEHNTTPQDYTLRYDAIVAGVRRVSPNTKFMGPALGDAGDLNFIQYFLNPANHQPGIPIDYLSYHFYAVPPAGQTIDDWQYEFFQQADGFVSTVQSIETIRKALSPQTKTDIDELGTILQTDNTPADVVPPPAAYWNLSGAMYAYLYMKLARMQIDVVGESQLVGFPTQFPSVSMMDWTTNQPDARFWVLKLLKDSFHPGDKLVETSLSVPNSWALEAQAFVTTAGQKLLVVNKTNVATSIPLPDAGDATALTVDEQSGEGPARSVNPANGAITLQPFSVTVVSW